MDTMAVIEEHRKMLVLSQNVSDFHVHNLQKWVLVFLDKSHGLKTYSISFNFKKNGVIYAGDVMFELMMNPQHDKEVLKKNLDDLEQSVKILFWEQTNVKFKVNGAIWKKTKKIQPKKSPNTPKTSQSKRRKASKATSKTDVQV